MTDDISFFNEWAVNYDDSVLNTNDYPFIEFENLLINISNSIMYGSVLDLGCGTGELYKLLLKKKDVEYLGVDFSDKMLEIAKIKYPTIKIINSNIANIVKEEKYYNSFDYIVSNYVFHHFNEESKVNYINSLLFLLQEGGSIIIGDICFENSKLFEDARKKFKDSWDESEYYIIFEDFKYLFESHINLEFIKNSDVNGLIIIKGKSRKSFKE